jgi:hypothetical protein
MKALRDAANIPSGEVRSLLGSRAHTSNLEGNEWLAMPWVDFVAVGQAPSGKGNASWAALITSVPDKVRKAAKDTFLIACPHPRPRTCAKLRRYLKAIDDLDAYGKAIRSTPEAGVYGANAAEVIKKACSRDFGDESVGGGGGSAGIEVLVLCAQADLDSVALFFASTSITPEPVLSLRSFFASSLVGIRIATGVGWFPDSDRFAQVIKGAAKEKRPQSIIQLNAIKAPGSYPRQRAVEAGSMLASMGWSAGKLEDLTEHAKKSPGNGAGCMGWSVKDLIEHARKNPGKGAGCMGWSDGEKSPGKGAGYRWSDGDVQVFTMPNAYLPGDEVIEANSREELIKDTWHTFESTFPQDQVLIAIRYKGNGSRSAKPQDDHDTKNFCLLPPLHISAAGLLRRVFGKCDIQVIGYTAGESATTRSGLMERLTKRYRLNPGDADAKANLVDWIRRLAHPERLAEPRESILDECCKIEAGPAGAIPEGDHLKNAGSRNKPSLLALAFRRGLTDRGSFRSGCLLAGAVVREILRFKRVDILNMINRPATSAVGRFDEIRGLNQKVQEHFAADKDVGRSHGAKFRLLTLYKDLALVFANLCRGSLGLTDKLQAWVRSNFEFFCVMPMDHVAPVSPDTPTMRRSYTGQFQSCRNYPLLFSGPQEDASVLVEIGPLLAIVGQALDLGGKDRSRGWLTHKISETNEMATSLLMRIGSDVDFPLESLALDFARTGDLGLILDQLDSRLMVRCIIESQGGDQALRIWSKELATAVKQQWLAASPPGDSDYLANFEMLDSLFDFFRDYTGLAVAALDCCRESLRARPADAGCPVATRFRIFFRSDKIREVFRLRRPKQSSRETRLTEFVESALADKSVVHHTALGNECVAIVNELAAMIVRKPLDMLSAIELAHKLRELDPQEARSMAEHLRSVEEHLNESRGDLSDPVCFRALRKVLLRG